MKIKTKSHIYEMSYIVCKKIVLIYSLLSALLFIHSCTQQHIPSKRSPMSSGYGSEQKRQSSCLPEAYDIVVRDTALKNHPTGGHQLYIYINTVTSTL